MKRMGIALRGVMILLLAAAGMAARAGEVRVYPAPAGEAFTTTWSLAANGQTVPVYVAKVARADKAGRWKAMDDKVNSALYHAQASFASFDMAEGPVRVQVASARPVREVKILPTSAGIKPKVEGSRISFTLDRPRQLTLEINGDWVDSLQIFANPLEKDAPKPNDPGVIYFGPGVHDIEGMHVGSGQTVYIAGGAVVHGKLKNGRRGGAVFSLVGNNITLRGRGIIDGGLFPTHAQNMISVRGSNITLEGVILRDSPHWTVPIKGSDHVTVKNLKLIGYRANSDGIDICNSRDVTVTGCFLRTLDDLVVIKTIDKGTGEARNITVTDCVLWNEVAHALSIGAELRDDVQGVRFADCDVIHDKGREWTLRVYHCDGAKIGGVTFENIRIEETRKLISLWIGSAIWSKDEERGEIDGVTFRDIQAVAKDKPIIELKGFDAQHTVRNASFERVAVNGQPVKAEDVKRNEFVDGISVKP